jgi:sec-independent protein translocase protein TatB
VLRELRRIAEGAKTDLRDGLGPEFADFDIDDLNPRRFVQKHLFSDPEEPAPDELAPDGTDASGAGPDTAVPAGRQPAFDTEAT